jgi:hypothetical protein
MSATYSQEQQIHSLSLLSNAVFGVSVTQAQGGAAELQTIADTIVSQTLADSTVQGLIGDDWTTVWGPIVYSSDPGANSVVADNTMILFNSPSQNLFVLAIAGTNIDSMYDWFKEDFAVNSRVSWSSIVGSDVHIPFKDLLAAVSGGAATGLQTLLGMQDSNGNTMIDALTTAVGKLTNTATLAVAGHSLGGALSPTMALYLHDIQQTSSNWNTSGNINSIQAWPTAGPTPGNGSWASYYEYVVGTELSQYGAPLSYTSKYNTLDVVPQAWQKSTLANVPTIYEPNISQPKGSNPTEVITGVLAVGAVLNSVDTSNLLSLFNQVTPWTSMAGTFDTTTDTGIKNKLQNIGLVIPSELSAYQDYFVNLARFLAQMAFQHTTAYNTLLDIEDFAAEYATIKQNNNPDGKSDAQLHEEALGRRLGVDLSKLKRLN